MAWRGRGRRRGRGGRHAAPRLAATPPEDVWRYLPSGSANNATAAATTAIPEIDAGHARSKGPKLKSYLFEKQLRSERLGRPVMCTVYALRVRARGLPPFQQAPACREGPHLEARLTLDRHRQGEVTACIRCFFPTTARVHVEARVASDWLKLTACARHSPRGCAAHSTHSCPAYLRGTSS